jgi:hypothetical protein
MNRDTRNEDKIADVPTEKVLTAYSRLDNTRLCELVSSRTVSDSVGVEYSFAPSHSTRRGYNLRVPARSFPMNPPSQTGIVPLGIPR